MAKRLKAEDAEDATRLSNSAERAKIIREVAGEVIRLKGEKAAIQEQITEAKGRIKSLDIKMSDFNAALRYFELEVEDRDPALDSLRECFKALGVGAQLNFLDALEVQKTKEAAAGLH